MLLHTQVEDLLRFGTNVDLSQGHNFLIGQLEEFVNIAVHNEAQLTIPAKGLLSTQLEHLARTGGKYLTIVL